MERLILNMYERMGRARPKADDIRSPVEVDRDRIVHSHAFRRLQRKTQIVGVNSIDFFRTRLTHTIECAQIGRAIARRITDDSWEGNVTDQHHLPDLVEAACLAHDLGHPPFGHTGEEALDAFLFQHWGLRFEGNAQSFRIITFLEPKKYRRLDTPIARPLGLDLTRATLQAMTKYPWSERDAPQIGEKFGVYAVPEDEAIAEWMWEGLPEQASKRILACDIMEAADDIAYAVHDIEDGTWARLIPIDQIVQLEEWAVERITNVACQRYGELFPNGQSDVANELEQLFQPIVNAKWVRGPFDRSRRSEGGLKSFCSALTDEFLRRVTEGGSLQWSGNHELQRSIAVLKSIVWVWMIEPPELVTKRYGQRQIIQDLVVGYMNEPGMLPYQDEWSRVDPQDEQAQARFVVDHVAGMTDAYAMNLHAEMRGTKLGSGWE